MNRTSRHLFVVVLVMFVSLMMAATAVQFFQAGSLNADTRNVRTIYREYGRDRGPIVVAGSPVANSVPTDGVFQYQREYAQGPLYAHLTGYFSTAFNSITGLERAENDVLNGTSSSFWPQRIQSLFTGKQPQGGVAELTIDPSVQEAARDALGDRVGAVVALEPATGRILAQYSSPTFDPNGLATHSRSDASAYLDRLQADPDSPLTNRALAGDQQPPGSVFKVVTAAAAMEAQGLTPDSTVEGGTELALPQTTATIRNDGGAACDGPGATTSLRTAFAQSCNTTFASLAMDVGAEGMRTAAQEFGFEQELSTPQQVTPSRYPLPGTAAETAMTGIGQASVRSTPLQMAMVAAAVANDGQLMRPYVVERELTADLQEVARTEPRVFSRPMSEQTAQQLGSMMRSVVTNGSGGRADVSGGGTAGKTGTAEMGADTAPTVWFIGYAPAEDPKVAVAVMIEDGGGQGMSATGGSVAAPVARDVLQAGVNRP